MKKILILALSLFAGESFGSTTINSNYQLYSTTTPQVFNAANYRTKTAIFQGYTTTGATTNFAGTAVIKCGPAQAGPFQQCTPSTSVTANGIVTWSDAVTWLQVTYTKTRNKVKIWILGNTY